MGLQVVMRLKTKWDKLKVVTRGKGKRKIIYKEEKQKVDYSKRK